MSESMYTPLEYSFPFLLSYSYKSCTYVYVTFRVNQLVTQSINWRFQTQQ